jgi:hypothetical protein
MLVCLVIQRIFVATLNPPVDSFLTLLPLDILNDFSKKKLFAESIVCITIGIVEHDCEGCFFLFYSGPEEEDSPCSWPSVETTANMSNMVWDLRAFVGN